MNALELWVYEPYDCSASLPWGILGYQMTSLARLKCRSSNVIPFMQIISNASFVNTLDTIQKLVTSGLHRTLPRTPLDALIIIVPYVIALFL